MTQRGFNPEVAVQTEILYDSEKLCNYTPIEY